MAEIVIRTRTSPGWRLRALCVVWPLVRQLPRTPRLAIQRWAVRGIRVEVLR